MASVQPRGRGRRTINEINMVPFIDVMLVLLIIFMVSAPLLPTGVVDLPSVGQARQTPTQVIEVVVESEDAVRDEAIALQRVLDDLSERRVQVALVILDAFGKFTHFADASRIRSWVETGRSANVPAVAQQYKAEKNLKSRQSGVVEASK